jgi:hypothetical protein
MKVSRHILPQREFPTAADGLKGVTYPVPKVPVPAGLLALVSETLHNVQASASDAEHLWWPVS